MLFCCDKSDKSGPTYYLSKFRHDFYGIVNHGTKTSTNLHV